MRRGSVNAAGARERRRLFQRDFALLWQTLGERYCFFGEKATDWCKVGRVHGRAVARCRSRTQFAAAAAAALAELYDAHTRLRTPHDGERRLPPYDLLVAPVGDAAGILAVREHSAAAAAGLRRGDMIETTQDGPMGTAAARLRGRCLAGCDPAETAYAWNRAVAGQAGQPRRLLVRRGAQRRMVELPVLALAAEPDIAWRRLQRQIGYVRIASFADPAMVAGFDAALADLQDTTGLILDVRRNGGGDTAVARPMMGRFISQPTAYARMRRRCGTGLGAAWTEHVQPRGPFRYAGAVTILVDPWSASMAEGFAMGMRSIARARLVGTRMMGLGAAVATLRLPCTGLELQYSAEPVYDVTGMPRWSLLPDLLLEDATDLLAAGTAELSARAGRCDAPFGGG